MRPFGTVLLAVLAAVPASGCFGMCGPSVNDAYGDGMLPAAFTPENATRMADALAGAGFDVRERSAAFVHAIRGTEAVSLGGYGENTTVSLRYEVPHREFRDTEGGHNTARMYADEQAQARQADAQAVYDLLAASVGAAAATAPPLQGSISIC